MGENGWLTERFEEDRPRLRAVAHRMLGSRVEAEDAVQETWLRLAGADPASIDNLGGWLTTVTARVCLDRLRRRSARPEHDARPPLPEDPPVPGDDDPAEHAVLADSVGAALLVVLDALGPAERVAFVLHDVFAVPFDEVAAVLDRSPDAARQLASRARRRVQRRTSAGDVDPARQREVVDAFLRAAQGGDFEELLRVLHPDVVLRPDAAAVGMGTLRETHGAEGVAALLSGGAQAARPAVVDGLAGLVWAPGGTIRGVVEFTVVGGRIVAMDVTGDEGRMGELEIVVLDS
jgi:RNA polymerase sigma-70 factor (ECF subfamily)